MFTNNYIKFQRERFTAKSSSSVSLINAENNPSTFYGSCSFFSEIGCCMGIGQCKSIIGSNSSYPYPSSSGYGGVYFGSGSTPATKDDYRLESPITSGLSITNPKSLYWVDVGNGKYIVSSPFIVTNITDSDIFISEIGVFTPVSAVYDKGSNSSQTLNYCLMERTVLSEPITIPAGESKLVTYKLTFNQKF